MNTINKISIKKKIEILSSDFIKAYNVYFDMIDQNTLLAEYFMNNIKNKNTVLFSMNLTSNYDKLLIINFNKNLSSFFEVEIKESDYLYKSLNNDDEIKSIIKNYIQYVVKKYKIVFTIDCLEIKHNNIDLIPIENENQNIERTINILEGSEVIDQIIIKDQAPKKIIKKPLTKKDLYSF